MDVRQKKRGVSIMKLKKVLCVTFFSMTLLPVLLFVVLISIVSMGGGNFFKNPAGVVSENYKEKQNSIQILSNLTKDIHGDLVQIAKENPEKLTDISYLSEVDRELEKDSSFLIVRQGKEYIFIGDNKEQSDWDTYLPEYISSETSPALDGGFYVGGNLQALVKKVDFVSAKGVNGSAYIITKSEVLTSMFRSVVIKVLIVVMVVMLLTGGLLSWWIYRSVTTPLKKLREATQNIKDGNLDFTIEVDRDDTIGELCADFEDMRKRLKMTTEEKLEYDKESKELISNISHDLKTPITAIKGYMEGIMDGVADTPEKMERYIRTVYNKANDMDRLINELTFYSKIDTNRIPYTFHKINVIDYFSDCVDELYLELESKPIKLQYFDYIDSNITVIADAEQLKRVINNIIGNSIKYMDKEQGIIIIRLRDIGDYIQVEIEDNGKGIGANELPYIFDRFYRTDTSRNSKQGGSGIGLSIVKKVIEDHGGEIWADSKESTGTVMYFKLKKYQEVTKNE